METKYNKIAKNLVLFFIVFLNFNSSKAQTFIPGGVVSGTWNLSGSPYLVQGAIMIADGTTLAIDPGVKVEFQGNYKFLIMGRILAIGTLSDSITFTSTDTTIGWLGIRFDNTISTNDSSKFFFCKFQYGKASGVSSISDGGALYFNNFSKAIISNSEILNCYAQYTGGGIYCNSSSPVIKNNKIHNNVAAGISGGGIYCIYSNPIIVNNDIYNNNATHEVGRGGGICCYYSSTANISDNIFYNNSAFRGGAIFSSSGSSIISNNTIYSNNSTVASGVCCEFSNPNITNNTFTNNYGTAIYSEGSNPIITNNIISNNNGSGIFCSSNCTSNIFGNMIYNCQGIGIGCSGSSLNISNNIISNNIGINGAGIYCSGAGNSIIYNNSITNNTATSYGGGIYCSGNSPIILNNTIANNIAVKGGALYCTLSSDPTIRNTILWGNIATTGNQVFLDDEASDPNIYYSNVQGGSSAFGVNSNVFYLGTYSNNLNTNPQFVNPSSGTGSGYDGITANWTLQTTSPCINAGDPAGSYTGTDLAGNPRVSGGIIDIGAYESLISGISKNNLKREICIFPNPTTDRINLSWSLKEKLIISILDISDQLIYQKISESGSSITIDVSGFTKGFYFVNVTGNDFVDTRKLIIQ